MLTTTALSMNYFRILKQDTNHWPGFVQADGQYHSHGPPSSTPWVSSTETYQVLFFPTRNIYCITKDKM